MMSRVDNEVRIVRLFIAGMLSDDGPSQDVAIWQASVSARSDLMKVLGDCPDAAAVAENARLLTDELTRIRLTMVITQAIEDERFTFMRDDEGGLIF